MLYIAATVEDLSSYEGLKCFTKPALAAMIDWYDEQEIDQEVDAAELRGDWDEYDDAGPCGTSAARWTRRSRSSTTPTSWNRSPTPWRPEG